MDKDAKEQLLLKKIKQRRKRTFGIAATVLIIVCIGLAVTILNGNDGLVSDSRTVTLEITCSDLVRNMDRLRDDTLWEYIPENGEILSPVEVALREDDTVYDVLYRQCREDNIHLESHNDPIYDSRYIEGIGHLYEKDAGKRSGWIYEVNGTQPKYGCSKYILRGGEKIEWIFVTDYTKRVD